MDTPMVMITRLMAGAPATGRMVRRSMTAPTTVVARAARTTARPTGRPRCAKDTANMPPSMTNSPWAKLMRPVVLKMMVKPSAVRP